VELEAAALLVEWSSDCQTTKAVAHGHSAELSAPRKAAADTATEVPRPARRPMQRAGRKKLNKSAPTGDLNCFKGAHVQFLFVGAAILNSKCQAKAPDILRVWSTAVPERR